MGFDPSKPLTDEARRLLQERGFKAIEKFFPSVRPLLRLDHDGELEAVATGVLLRAGDTPLLLSAAHALKELSGYFLPANGGAAEVFGQAHLLSAKGTPKDDPIDIAVLELAERPAAQLGESCFLSPSDLNTSVLERPEVYLAMGYPTSISRRSWQQRPGESQVMAFSNLEAPDNFYDQLDLGRSTHIAVPFERDRALSRKGTGPAPNPHGISGGAILHVEGFLGSDPVAGSEKLAGIVHTWEQMPAKALVGTRIDLFLDAVRFVRPDLAKFLPAPGKARLRFHKKD